MELNFVPKEKYTQTDIQIQSVCIFLRASAHLFRQEPNFFIDLIQRPLGELFGFLRARLIAIL